MTWNKPEDKPQERQWVLGLCQLNDITLVGYNPVVFQVKYTKHHGWTDWCGDGEKEGDWTVIGWMPIPEYNITYVLNKSDI